MTILPTDYSLNVKPVLEHESVWGINHGEYA